MRYLSLASYRAAPPRTDIVAKRLCMSRANEAFFKNASGNSQAAFSSNLDTSSTRQRVGIALVQFRIAPTGWRFELVFSHRIASI